MPVPRLRAVRLAITLFLIALAYAVAPAIAAQVSLQARYSALDSIQIADMRLPTMKMAAAIAKQYHRDFAPLQTPSALARLSTTDVRVLFRAASLVAFYLPGGEYMAAMSGDLRDLERRGAGAPGDYAKMDEAYVNGRDLEAARTLRRTHPGVGSGVLPSVVDRRLGAAGPSVLVLSPDMQHLFRVSSSLRGKRIVILSSPLCHFCQGASRALDVDPRFQAALHKYATWLAPPDGSTFEMVHAWNAKHLFEAMSLMYSETEWPMIDDIATPTFFFFDGPTLIAKVTGWPVEGNKAAILAAMRKIGISLPHPI
jgi:hypothetical protein